MDTTRSLDFSAILEAYDKARWTSAMLNDDISDSVGEADILETGRRLGVLHQNHVIIRGDSELSVIMDFAIRHIYRDGKNAIERYPSVAKRTLGPNELDAVGRMAVSRYRILEINAVEPGVGALVTDRLRRENSLLVDRALSTTTTAGSLWAGNVVEWDGFGAGTGAALPMFGRIWDKLERPILKRFGKFGPKYSRLDPLKQADLAAWCTRACLEAGMAQRVVYQTPTRAGT